MPSRNEPPPSTFRSRALRALAYLASIALIAAYCFAFLSRGFSEYSDEKVDFVRAGRILEQGLDGFYDEDAHISPYPPFALLALALFRAAFPTLTAFKTAFFLLLLFDGLLFYLSLRRYNAGPAPFFTLLFLTFPFLRLGVVTLHPTDYLFLLFVLLSVYIHRANDSASLALLGLSVATKWYTAFSAFLLPFVYRRDREFAVKSASILPLSIFFGLIFPAFVFPNYLRIYVLHAEKSIGQIGWIEYSYGVKVPTLSLPPPYHDLAGGMALASSLAFIALRARGRSLSYASSIALSTIPAVFLASMKYPHLRFCAFPLALSLLASKPSLALIPLTLLFFLRYNVLASATALLILLWIALREPRG